MSEVKQIIITLAAPKPPNNHGKVAVGHFKVEGDTVVLTDRAGNPLDRYRLTKKVPPGGNVEGIACNLLRSRYSSQAGDFNRVLVYPKLKY